MDKTGGPAFYNIDGHGYGSSGMSLRDYMAAMAMQACAYRVKNSNMTIAGLTLEEEIAQACYLQADAMIKARGE